MSGGLLLAVILVLQFAGYLRLFDGVQAEDPGQSAPGPYTGIAATPAGVDVRKVPRETGGPGRPKPRLYPQGQDKLDREKSDVEAQAPDQSIGSADFAVSNALTPSQGILELGKALCQSIFNIEFQRLTYQELSQEAMHCATLLTQAETALGLTPSASSGPAQPSP
jgi:hypothetical protein